MKYTKEEITQRILEVDTDYFYNIYNETYSSNDEVETVYEQNLGDGNEYVIAMSFKKMDRVVLLQGTYSSWDSPSWDSVNFAVPFEFVETRYKPITIEDIRDKQINDVLDETK